MLKSLLTITCLLILSASQGALAQTRYVTDQFEIMMRTGQGNQFGIVRQLKSGTEVTVIEQNADYTQVRLSSGAEGWVLTRYLMDQPSGRDQVAALQLKYDQLKANFDQQVEQETQNLQKEIARLENLAKKPLELQQENAALKKQLEQQKENYLALAEESEILKSPYKDRQWFVTGAFVVAGSMIFGIILTRIPWQRKKRWNEL
jgi:SH3 domain protein